MRRRRWRRECEEQRRKCRGQTFAERSGGERRADGGENERKEMKINSLAMRWKKRGRRHH